MIIARFNKESGEFTKTEKPLAPGTKVLHVEEKPTPAAEVKTITIGEARNGRKCPVCGKEYTAPPAMSRKDNKTEICPLCGLREALDAVPLTEEQKAEIIATAERNGENERL